jgi:hypothetical protein
MNMKAQHCKYQSLPLDMILGKFSHSSLPATCYPKTDFLQSLPKSSKSYFLSIFPARIL